MRLGLWNPGPTLDSTLRQDFKCGATNRCKTKDASTTLPKNQMGTHKVKTRRQIPLCILRLTLTPSTSTPKELNLYLRTRPLQVPEARKPPQLQWPQDFELGLPFPEDTSTQIQRHFVPRKYFPHWLEVLFANIFGHLDPLR